MLNVPKTDFSSSVALIIQQKITVGIIGLKCMIYCKVNFCKFVIYFVLDHSLPVFFFFFYFVCF